MSKETMKLALEAAYLAGFNASNEDYNSEFFFDADPAHPEQNPFWVKDRDNYVSKALAEQTAPQETEEKTA
jgi:hypothetical protein